MTYTVPNVYMRTVNSTYRSWPTSISSLVATSANLSVNGQDATGELGRRIILNSGNYNLSAQNTNLLYSNSTFGISGFTGTFVEGSSLTINGAAFTTKRNGQMLFDDFSDGNIGDPISARGVWRPFENDTTVEYLISNASVYTGTKSARAHPTVNFNTLGADDFGNQFLFATTKEFYIEYAVRVHMIISGTSTMPDGPQIKMHRYCGNFHPNAGDPVVTMTRFNDWNSNNANSIIHLQGGGDLINQSCYIDGQLSASPDWFPQDTWCQVADYTRLSSTPGVSDGASFANVNGNGNISFGGHLRADPYNEGITNPAWKSAQDILTARSANSNQLDTTFSKLTLPYFKRDEMEFYVDVGYVYSNDSPERVVVCDSSNFYASTTKRMVQKTNSRTPSSINITCKKGQLPSTGSLWVFVVNSNNAISTGFQIR